MRNTLSHYPDTIKLVRAVTSWVGEQVVEGQALTHAAPAAVNCHHPLQKMCLYVIGSKLLTPHAPAVLLLGINLQKKTHRHLKTDLYLELPIITIPP